MQMLPLFYYPSTLIAIDDDPLFLKAISQLFDLHHFKAMRQPSLCNDFFKRYHPPLANTSFLQATVDHEYYGTLNHSIVNIDIAQLYTLKNNKNRFEEVSVMIIDYNMPEMNGIELCQNLADIPAKKILLTGEAENHYAINAFNNNIINKFIRKDNQNLADEIKLQANLLSKQYFSEKTAAMLSHLEAERSLPISDPLFIDFFNQWCIANKIKEYYLADKNGSFLTIDHHNQEKILLVHCDHTLNQFIELNSDNDHAKNFLSSILKRDCIPFFGIGRESWEIETSAWGQYLYEPKVLEGRERYFWAAVKI